ncbi:anaerobic sulfatase maturase [bacterium]|nr:anaerobic sulfatase maturase [bacterium]
MDLPILNQPKKQLTSVLVKPASADCNLKCEYCFYLEKAGLFPETKVHRMADEVLEEMVKQVMQAGSPQVSFGWQGGEPTLMGLDFFRKAVEFQQQYGNWRQTVGNGMQTNGLVIDEEWCEFLLEYNFLVGLSLDGPQHVHDKYRLFGTGKGSWDKVRKAGDLMLEKGVAVNALVVVNDYSWQFAEEIYETLKGFGYEFMQFIPCVEPHPTEPNQVASFSVNGEQYGEFLCKLYDCWKKDFKDGLPTTSVRYFDSIFHLYVDMAPPECTLLEECGCYTVIEHNGDIYSCDFFVTPEWKLGNVKTDNLLEALNSDRQNEFGCLKSNRPPECQECKWLEKCWGGCTKDRLNSPNGVSNYFCKGYMMFLEHADADLQQIAEEWIERQKAEEEAYRRRMESISHLSETPDEKPGRNDPCPCGSGKKYKKCCGKVNT